MQKHADVRATAISAGVGGLLGGAHEFLHEREAQRVPQALDEHAERSGQLSPDVLRLRNYERLHKSLKSGLVGGAVGAALGGGGAHLAQKYAPALAESAGKALRTKYDALKSTAAREADEFVGARARHAGESLGQGAMDEVGKAVSTHADAAGRAAARGAAEQGKAEVVKPVQNLWQRIRHPFSKKGSAMLSEKIAGTINKSDFDAFEKTFSDDIVRGALPDCPSTLAALSKIASRGVGSPITVKGAMKLASRNRLDVVQVTPTQYGYLVKWSSAPDGVQPQQKELSVPQAQQALPQEALQAADDQGVATMTQVEAEPDPLVESPQPVEGFGTYKVHELATGNEIVGFVIPTLFDPRTGQATPQKLFTNGSAFAIQPEIVGVLTGVSYNLPAGPEQPRGLGVFYKTDGKGIIATIPFTVMTSMTIEGRQYYAAQTPEGQEVQIVPSDGLRRPVATSPGEIAMPVDYTWLPLNGEVQLMGAPDADPMQQAKQAAVDSSAVVRAWSDGFGSLQGVNLSGPVFAKLGSGDYDVPGALFNLAAAGVPQNLALALMDKAASTGKPQRMYGLRTLDPEPAEMKEALADALGDLATSGIRIPSKPCLLKEAMAIEMCKEAKDLVGVDSLDTLLSLGFINAENVQTFVDAIPEIEETSSKLAELVFATQLGLQSVPKTAALHAMRSLEDVLTGLRGLRDYRL